MSGKRITKGERNAIKSIRRNTKMAGKREEYQDLPYYQKELRATKQELKMGR